MYSMYCDPGGATCPQICPDVCVLVSKIDPFRMTSSGIKHTHYEWVAYERYPILNDYL